MVLRAVGARLWGSDGSKPSMELESIPYAKIIQKRRKAMKNVCKYANFICQLAPNRFTVSRNISAADPASPRARVATRIAISAHVALGIHAPESPAIIDIKVETVPRRIANK